MATQMEIFDGTQYIPLTGVPGPTYFVRAADRPPNPRKIGDLWVNTTPELYWTTEWIYPTLINGWSNYGAQYAPARFRKTADNVVYVDGLITGGSGVAFIMPYGFRTTRRIIYASSNGNNLVPHRNDVVNGTGEFYIVTKSGTSWASCQCVFYSDL